jgi:hypothetical protein
MTGASGKHKHIRTAYADKQPRRLNCLAVSTTRTPWTVRVSQDRANTRAVCVDQRAWRLLQAIQRRYASPVDKPGRIAGNIGSARTSMLNILSSAGPSTLLDCITLTRIEKVDRNLSEEPEAKQSGSTASVAIMHSLDTPFTPFYSSQKLAMTVVHVGYVLALNFRPYANYSLQ